MACHLPANALANVHVSATPSLPGLPLELQEQIAHHLASAQDVFNLERALWPVSGNPTVWNERARALPVGAALVPPPNANNFRHAFKDGTDAKRLGPLPGAAVLRSLEMARAFASRSPLTQQLLATLNHRHAALRGWVTSAHRYTAPANTARELHWRKRLDALKTELAPSTVFGEVAARARVDALRRDPPENLLRAFIESGDSASRWVALDALFDYGSPQDTNVHWVRLCLDDENDDIRKLACFVLGYWCQEARGTPLGTSIAQIITDQAARETDKDVSSVAAWANADSNDTDKDAALRAWRNARRPHYSDAERYAQLGFTTP